MKYCTFINAALSLLLQFYYIEAKRDLVDVVKIVEEVNSNTDLPWKADNYGYKEIDLHLIKQSKLGAKLPDNEPLNETEPQKLMALAKVPATDIDKIGLPVNFTWQNPNNTKCPIGHIRDQSNCGSCWAVSTVSALSDRFCIQSRGKVNQNMSEEFVLSCSSENYGCDGGYMDRVNNFMIKVGTITGGDYESDKGCQMYTIQPCGFPISHRMPCDHNNAIKPKCKKRKCNNDWYKYKTEPEDIAFKAKSWYLMKSNSTHSREDRARDEIFRNGPLVAAFLMPRDFLFYKKGVYVPPAKPIILGGHLVRVIGYGIENGLKYWHCANSWSPMWGEEGFFKIIRGVNALVFERWMGAVTPNL